MSVKSTQPILNTAFLAIIPTTQSQAGNILHLTFYFENNTVLLTSKILIELFLSNLIFLSLFTLMFSARKHDITIN